MNTSTSASPVHVYVDVDDTLVRSAGSKRIPMPSVIQHVRELHAQGAVLYCWSAGGAEYARRSAEEFGIADCFTAFLPKPNVFIDDQHAAEWPRSVLVHPSSCSGRSLDDYRGQLR
jgi:predicted HAD superfamily phosphohydrolase YqeG